MGMALAAIALAGCSHFEEDDLFDESAALRIGSFNKQLQTLLVKQSSDGNHGWVIQYYVAGTDDYDFEGFNLFGRFYDNGKVTMAGNHRYLRDGKAGKYTEFTSLYEVLTEEGPVLAFNTWNDILTVFVDPVDPSPQTGAPTYIVKDGEGMNGDQNLVFKAYKGDAIVFNGERHSAEVRFVPCDRPWEDYVKDTETTKNYITTATQNPYLNSYYVISGTDTLYFTGLRKGLFTYCERVVNPQFPSTINCVFTPKGFCLQHQDSIGGTAFQEFTLTEDKTHLLSEDGKVKVILTWDMYLANQFVADNVMMPLDVDQFTPEQTDLYEKLQAAFKKVNSKFSLVSIGLGYPSSSEDTFTAVVLGFKRKASDKTPTLAALEIGVKRTAYGTFELTYSPDSRVSPNMRTVNQKTNDIETLTRQFAATLQGTYDVTPDNYFMPKAFQFTPLKGGSHFALINE